MSAEHILFLTGKLAEPALRRVVSQLSEQVGFDFEIEDIGVNVAALMHVDLVLRRLTLRTRYDRVLVPGWCQGEIERLAERFGIPFERGPKDLFDLPETFGRGRRPPVPLDDYDIDILAEINHAPRLDDAAIIRLAEHFRDSGADLIDLGCIPGECWGRVGEVTRLLVDQGFRVDVLLEGL